MLPLERLLLEQTSRLLMAELSGLNSPDKLLEATSHKVRAKRMLPPFSLETLDSEPSNGLLRSSSVAAELLRESELPLVRTRDQEDSPMLNSLQMLRLKRL